MNTIKFQSETYKKNLPVTFIIENTLEKEQQEQLETLSVKINKINNNFENFQVICVLGVLIVGIIIIPLLTKSELFKMPTDFHNLLAWSAAMLIYLLIIIFACFFTAYISDLTLNPIKRNIISNTIKSTDLHMQYLKSEKDVNNLIETYSSIEQIQDYLKKGAQIRKIKIDDYSINFHIFYIDQNSDVYKDSIQIPLTADRLINMGYPSSEYHYDVINNTLRQGFNKVDAES